MISKCDNPIKHRVRISTFDVNQFILKIVKHINTPKEEPRFTVKDLAKVIDLLSRNKYPDPKELSKSFGEKEKEFISFFFKNPAFPE
jgi:hypothetical protein